MALSTARRRMRNLPQADPNVIPFIDVLLVLLIIFMVTAPKPTTDLRVDLARQGAGPPPVIEPTIVELQAAPSGYRLIVAGREATLETVGEQAYAHVLGANPALTRANAAENARVFVRADLDVAYAPVVATVEALRAASFANVSMAAQRAEES